MTLAELKRKMTVGRRFEIIEHRFHPECSGTIRQVTKSSKTIMYSKDITNPDSKWATANNGLGAYLNFGTTKNWQFTPDGSIISYFNVYKDMDPQFVFSFRFVDE